jgi:hypothetical protein
MNPFKYQEFVETHPWFPRAARELIDWHWYSTGEAEPDRATKSFFENNVSHLGIAQYSQCDLSRPGVSVDTQFLQSRLLSSPVTIKLTRVFRVVFHSEGEPRFTRDHAMVDSSMTIQESIDEYAKLFPGHRVDALIECLFTSFGNMKTHRFDVTVFPTD